MNQTTDRLLLAELGLTLILIGLGIYLYLRPAAVGLPRAEWWHWMLLATLFFGVVALHMERRRRSSRRAVREAVREQGEEPLA